MKKPLKGETQCAIEMTDCGGKDRRLETVLFTAVQCLGTSCRTQWVLHAEHPVLTLNNGQKLRGGVSHTVCHSLPASASDLLDLMKL